jgi:hypothetical protein
MSFANGFVAIVIAVACGTAAAQTLVGTASDATGIDDLTVDGRTYDVTFEGGTFPQVFPKGVVFNETTGADAAADLAGALNQFSVTGIYQNCDAGCSVSIPFAVVDAAGDTYSWQVQTGEFYPIDLYWNVNIFPNGWDGNVPLLGGNSWGVFTPVSSAPEPATYGLMLFGLAGAALARRRRAPIATS